MHGRYAPYLFVAPGLLLLVVFFAYPLLDTLYLSLHRYNNFSPPTFVGLDNFRRAWGDELFWRVLANTLLYAVSVVPALVVLSFFMALLARQLAAADQRYFAPCTTFRSSPPSSSLASSGSGCTTPTACSTPSSRGWASAARRGWPMCAASPRRSWACWAWRPKPRG